MSSAKWQPFGLGLNMSHLLLGYWYDFYLFNPSYKYVDNNVDILIYLNSLAPEGF